MYGINGSFPHRPPAPQPGEMPSHTPQAWPGTVPHRPRSPEPEAFLPGTIHYSTYSSLAGALGDFPQPLRPTPPHLRIDTQGAHPVASGSNTQYPGHQPQLTWPQPPQQAEHDISWLRPDSPTYLELSLGRDLEKLHGTTAPNVPASIKEMDREQAAASEMFRNNIKTFDPTGILRAIGEFGQTFHVEGDRMVSHNAIHFQAGQAITMPPGSYKPETSQVIHSHLSGMHYPVNYPSNADYLAAYFNTKGNSGNLKGEMFYHPDEKAFYGYQPKVEPSTGQPQFHKLVNPFDMAPPPKEFGGYDDNRPLPDPGTWGSHFMQWTPPASPHPDGPGA